MYEYIKDNIARLEENIESICNRIGRKRDQITLVGVAKTFNVETTQAAIEYGLKDIGESRVQEAEPKISDIGDACTWHMIGHLQSNKVTKAVDIFNLIQSVDTLRLAEKINIKAENRGKDIDVLIEVNASGEPQKSGFIPEATLDMAEQVKLLPNVVIRGLMAIGPNSRDEDEIRRTFRITRSLYEEGQSLFGERFNILSMGMSGDYELAIEEGSNMLRIGSAIFGIRN